MWNYSGHICREDGVVYIVPCVNIPILVWRADRAHFHFPGEDCSIGTLLDSDIRLKLKRCLERDKIVSVVSKSPSKEDQFHIVAAYEALYGVLHIHSGVSVLLYVTAKVDACNFRVGDRGHDVFFVSKLEWLRLPMKKSSLLFAAAVPHCSSELRAKKASVSVAKFWDLLHFVTSSGLCFGKLTYEIGHGAVNMDECEADCSVYHVATFHSVIEYLRIVDRFCSHCSSQSLQNDSVKSTKGVLHSGSSSRSYVYYSPTINLALSPNELMFCSTRGSCEDDRAASFCGSGTNESSINCAPVNRCSPVANALFRCCESVGTHNSVVVSDDADHACVCDEDASDCSWVDDPLSVQLFQLNRVLLSGFRFPGVRAVDAVWERRGRQMEAEYGANRAWKRSAAAEAVSLPCPAPLSTSSMQTDTTQVSLWCNSFLCIPLSKRCRKTHGCSFYSSSNAPRCSKSCDTSSASFSDRQTGCDGATAHGAVTEDVDQAVRTSDAPPSDHTLTDRCCDECASAFVSLLYVPGFIRGYVGVEAIARPRAHTACGCTRSQTKTAARHGHGGGRTGEGVQADVAQDVLGEVCTVQILTRLCNRWCGTRYNRRGLEPCGSGVTANFALTSVWLVSPFRTSTGLSHGGGQRTGQANRVQRGGRRRVAQHVAIAELIRGSVPRYWKQPPNFSFAPPLKLTRTCYAMAEVLSHIHLLQRLFPQMDALTLLDTTSRTSMLERPLSDGFAVAAEALQRRCESMRSAVEASQARMRAEEGVVEGYDRPGAAVDVTYCRRMQDSFASSDARHAKDGRAQPRHPAAAAASSPAVSPEQSVEHLSLLRYVRVDVGTKMRSLSFRDLVAHLCASAAWGPASDVRSADSATCVAQDCTSTSNKGDDGHMGVGKCGADEQEDSSTFGEHRGGGEKALACVALTLSPLSFPSFTHYVSDRSCRLHAVSTANEEHHVVAPCCTQTSELANVDSMAESSTGALPAGAQCPKEEQAESKACVCSAHTFPSLRDSSSARSQHCDQHGNSRAWRVVQSQSHYVRVNCLDCLDRTNLSQCILAEDLLLGAMLEAVLDEGSASASSTACESVRAQEQDEASVCLREGCSAALRRLFAGQGIALSRLYAGSDPHFIAFLRSGGKLGAMERVKEGAVAFCRWYCQNFCDGRKQDAVSLATGQHDPAQYKSGVESPFSRDLSAMNWHVFYGLMLAVLPLVVSVVLTFCVPDRSSARMHTSFACGWVMYLALLWPKLLRYRDTYINYALLPYNHKDIYAKD